jgi:hypothetical protein
MINIKKILLNHLPMANLHRKTDTFEQQVPRPPRFRGYFLYLLKQRIARMNE